MNSPFRPVRSFCTELRLSTYLPTVFHFSPLPCHWRSKIMQRWLCLGNPHGLGEGLGFSKREIERTQKINSPWIGYEVWERRFGGMLLPSSGANANDKFYIRPEGIHKKQWSIPSFISSLISSLYNLYIWWKCNLQHVGSVSMKWLLLLDITQDIYRQFHYFTMVTSDQILEKYFFLLG